MLVIFKELFANYFKLVDKRFLNKEKSKLKRSRRKWFILKGEIKKEMNKEISNENKSNEYDYKNRLRDLVERCIRLEEKVFYKVKKNFSNKFRVSARCD